MNRQRNQKYVWISIPIGTGFGVALGLVMMQILDHPGFFAVGIGLGFSIGTTIGLALDRR